MLQDPTTLPNHNLSVRQAVEKYLVLRVDEGMNAEGDTYRHLKRHLNDELVTAMGVWPLRQVQADHLREWAKALRNPRTGSTLEALTRRHYLISVKTFFKRAHVEGWVDRNVSAAVILPKVVEEDVHVIPVRDAFEFFKKNRDHRAVGRLAMEAFGGIRYSTAGRITKAEIKFDREGIEMPSNKHKSTKRKYRQGQPSCMWMWLRHAPEECWALTLRQYADEKKEMLILAGLRPMILKNDADRAKVKALANIWRHSFASYLLARTKNYEPVRYLMQHTNDGTTEKYEGRVDDFDAVLYLAITPLSVLATWEDFVLRVRLEMNGPAPIPFPGSNQQTG